MPLPDLAPLFPNADQPVLISQDLLNLYVLIRDYARRHTHTGKTEGPLLTSSALTWPLLAPDGTASAPSYSFTGVEDTSKAGWYRIGQNNFGFSLAGVKIWDIVAGSLTLSQDLLFTDATYDIGALGVTRPRDGFFSRNVVIGGTLGVTGAVTLTVPLAIASGGTNKALTLANGGIIWSDADSFEVSAAGTSGQILRSGGAGAPTWGNFTIDVYTPTVTNVQNFTGITARQCFYFQLIGLVIVFGMFSCTGSSTTLLNKATITLPLASTLGTYDLHGLCGGWTANTITPGGRVKPNGNNAEVAIITDASLTDGVWFAFAYIIN